MRFALAAAAWETSERDCSFRPASSARIWMLWFVSSRTSPSFLPANSRLAITWAVNRVQKSLSVGNWEISSRSTNWSSGRQRYRLYVAQADSSDVLRLDLGELGVGQRDLRGQVVALDRQPLVEPVLDVPASERGELLDVAPGRVQVPLGAEHADVGLGDRQLEVDRGPAFLGLLGVELVPGRVDGPQSLPPV